MIDGKSILVLGEHPERRLVAADAFRDNGAVVVEAATVHRARAILRHFRFDLLAVDSFGLGVGVMEFIHKRVFDRSSTHLCVIALSGDSNELARSRRSYLSFVWPPSPRTFHVFGRTRR